jgi:hypothetical protein
MLNMLKYTVSPRIWKKAFTALVLVSLLAYTDLGTSVSNGLGVPVKPALQYAMQKTYNAIGETASSAISTVGSWENSDWLCIGLLILALGSLKIPSRLANAIYRLDLSRSGTDQALWWMDRAIDEERKNNRKFSPTDKQVKRAAGLLQHRGLGAVAKGGDRGAFFR